MGRKSKYEREGEWRLNNQGYLMKIIKYNSFKDIYVEFQDKYKAIVNTQYHHFIDGTVQNPYHPTVYGVGIVGNKYPSSIENSRHTKEYEAWRSILCRSFDAKYKIEKSSYKDVTCCDEWLLYENFYEWVHSQSNFDKWHNNKGWNVDKDIIVKNNKIYSPETCCLVPRNVNILFVRNVSQRGNLPIGVQYRRNNQKYIAQCRNVFDDNTITLGFYNSVEEAFSAYKQYKEYIIQKVAKIEFENGNITQKCYDSMMNYKVEITD